MADEGSDTSDESLDVRSEKFDPLKALYSSKVRLASSVPIYDNISKFESILKGINVSTKDDKSAVPESTRERFLSHQGKERERDNTILLNVYAQLSHASREMAIACSFAVHVVKLHS
ncbi:hypothetical protein ALC53_07172 [Atta colombica]|uniref:Uncharacterized protein n=1 Tax=Atta colombica TaxID=520822 RepID=A0A195BDU2_9HYME|nr:hypothetical protein ALC53_07172 [Atta colombica]